MREDAVSYETTGVMPAESGVLLAALNASSGLCESITVAMSPEMRAALKAVAYDNDLSMSVIVRRAVWDYLTAVYRGYCPDPHDELGRLRGMIRYCIEGPDDPAALKMVMRDALDGSALRSGSNVRACGGNK